MAKSGNQKGKLLYLAEIFHRETDEAQADRTQQTRQEYTTAK